MKTTFFLLAAVVALSVVVTEAKRKDWVLLIAGSRFFYNYRHQADVCHAYQIFHKAGIPDEQIVVMMYDDIANNTINPVKGNIINRPGGPNVYEGVLKDYTGEEVNSETFLAVLEGDKSTVRRLIGHEGKVIDSGPEDHIFVYFADHGAPGVLGMPNGKLLKARDLIWTLISMWLRERYAKLVFYVEACESGSIFHDRLPFDMHLYGFTASSPTESSYACYYDEKRDTYLGDVFSVSWMEDTDKKNIHKETFEEQYEIVKTETNTSHVHQYGDTTFTGLPLDQFFGPAQAKPASALTFAPKAPTPRVRDAIPSEMVPLMILQKRIESAPINSKERAELQKQLMDLKREKEEIHDLFHTIAKTVYRHLPDHKVYDLAFRKRNIIENWGCYEEALDIVEESCPGINISNNDFALRKLYVLVNLCNNNARARVIRAVRSVLAVNPLCVKGTRFFK